MRRKDKAGMGKIKHCKGLYVELENGKYMVEAVKPNIFHCVYTKREEISGTSALGILRKPPIMQEQEETQEKWSVCSERIRLEVDKKTGAFLWKKRGGEILLEEGGKELKETPFVIYSLMGQEPVIRREKTVDGERNFIENLRPVEDHTAYQGKLRFRFQEGEHIYGLGQGEDGIYDYRGRTQYLYQHNMRTPMPFMVSGRGYAILMDCGCLMAFRDEGGESCLYMDCLEQMDYYFIAGERMDELIGGFRFLTGKAALLPKWAFGYIQSKEAYHTQQEILEVAARYRREGIPIDGIVQDWNTWEEDCWGNKRVDKKRYPDIGEMNRQLHEMNIHSMISIWPTMNSNTENYREMLEGGGLLSDYTTYDAFSEKGREIYWKQMQEELFSGGFDAWWCDSTEPFSGPDWNGAEKREDKERFELVGEEHKKYLRPDRANLYALWHAKGIFYNQRKETEEKRVLNLTRSGYPSIQKYGTILWSGDICATWDTFRKQITEGINMGLSGMPYWTMDIGGFFTVHENWRHRGCFCNKDSTPKWFWQGDYEEGVEDFGYRELYVRWFQAGAFLPVFRSHGTDTPREIWNFGKPGECFYDALADMIKMRYRLMPYLYSTAGMVWLKDDTMMRSLLFDFPEDAESYRISGEFMCGKSLLVCPVTEPMYYKRNSVPVHHTGKWPCYLPKGSNWYDFYTGEKYEGGKSLLRPAPLGEIPVFVKEGSIIPMESGLSYACEQVKSPLELHIYPGRDAKLAYYEDSGEGYGYEQGDYQVIQITWTEKERKLHISSANKKYAQSMAGRKCIAILGDRKREFLYSGQETELTF